jgi:hypothetical protein
VMMIGIIINHIETMFVAYEINDFLLIDKLFSLVLNKIILIWEGGFPLSQKQFEQNI